MSDIESELRAGDTIVLIDQSPGQDKANPQYYGITEHGEHTDPHLANSVWTVDWTETRGARASEPISGERHWFFDWCDHGINWVRVQDLPDMAKWWS